MKESKKTNSKKKSDASKTELQNKKPSGNLLKIFLILFSICLAGSGVFYYLISSNKMVLRSPVLYSRKARITFSYGEVMLLSRSETEWKKAGVGTVLEEGDSIKTGNRSKADLVFNDSMGLRLSENTLLKINHSDIYIKDIMIGRGEVYGSFKREFQDQNIRVHTPTATASVRGTELGFKLIEEKASEPETLSAPKTDDEKLKPETSEPVISSTVIYAISGIVEVENPEVKNSNLLLPYQTSIKINRSAPPEEPESISPPENRRLRNILNSIHMEEVLLISEKIFFDFNKDTIQAVSYQELNRIADILKKRDEVIRIEGHTDTIGSSPFNYRLSVRRAKAIRKHLLSKGIKKSRLQIRGYGSSRPIASNDTEKDRAANRRVEFIIVR